MAAIAQPVSLFFHEKTSYKGVAEDVGADLMAKKRHEN